MPAEVIYPPLYQYLPRKKLFLNSEVHPVNALARAGGYCRQADWICHELSPMFGGLSV